MFAQIRNALTGAISGRTAGPEQGDALAQWAADRLMSHLPMLGGTYALGGRLLDRPFRAECTTAHRDYIQGMELLAKADLDLSHEMHVVLLNRPLKRTLELKAHGRAADGGSGAQAPDKTLPEELRWLGMFRDAGWPGPPDAFWARYAVLTDAPELALRWLDSASIGMLMDWPAEVTAETPVMFMLMRGKAYLRMQIDRPDDRSAALHALDLFEHLCGRALQLFDR